MVLQDKVSGVLKPNGIIPFRIKNSDLRSTLSKLTEGMKLVPDNFIPDSKLQETMGIYVPFWLFDCEAHGAMSFDATKLRVWSDSKYNYTETSHFLLTRAGDMTFANIPVDASVKMDNDLMDSLEPFDFSEMKPYDSAYLSGFVADRFDDTVENCLPRASARVQTSIKDAFRSTVSGGYSSVTVNSDHTTVSEPEVTYVLLPVYLIRTTFEGKQYQYAINGQTGKIIGAVPVSKVKKRKEHWKYVGIWTPILTAVLSLLMLFVAR